MTRHEELLIDALDYLYDLQSEWAWKKGSSLGYKYDALCVTIDEIQELIQESIEQVIIPDDFL